MKSKTIFGALLVSAALCSPGFGFELLNGLLGLNNGGCGECKACAKVACCEKACPAPCAKVACCEKACPAPCEKVACCDPACGSCGHCKKCRITPVRDLFANLKDVFEAKGSICEPAACEAAQGCCPEPACEPACEKACKVKRCHKARACEKVSACDPACEKVAACEPACEKVKQPKCHKLYRRPVIELLEAIFGEPCKSCGCETACAAGCATGCDGAAPAAAPAKAPAKAPEAAAPLPAAPKADPSASIPSRGIYQASRTVVRN